MHLQRHNGANDYWAPDSVEHFKDGIARLIQLTTDISSTFTSFTEAEKTRGGLAAYDAGVVAVMDRRESELNRY